MGFRCGIVGLPNVGKSTLFNALTNANAQAENFPFCTIEPNSGVVPVPDSRLDEIARIEKLGKIIPGTMNFMDVPGLIEGASKGEGLGNQFLAHIREADALAHVVRCFTNKNVAHVRDDLNPPSDIEVVNIELALADLETASKVHERLRRVAKSGDKESMQMLDVLDKVLAPLDEGKPVRMVQLSERDRQRIHSCHFLTTKPVMYLANVDRDDFVENNLIEEVNRIARSENAVVVVVNSKLEHEIVQLAKEEREEFANDLGLNALGLNRVIRAGYQLLGLHHFFTAGPKEVRAWTVPIGTCASVAAGKIHTDFERGFIRAEVISYEGFIKFGGEAGAKAAGYWHLEGKDYIVKDGDVVRFRFNV